MCVKETIIHTIRENGPLSFHDFMEIALYHPHEGYYACNRQSHETAGRLKPESRSLIGNLLASQLAEMWKLLDKNTFTVVEYGSGYGTFCGDLFDFFRDDPDRRSRLHYCIIGKKPGTEIPDLSVLCPYAEWFASIDELPYVPDCIFSNNAANAFSVHEVVMQHDLMEVFVDYRNGFVEILKPATEELTSYLHEMNVTLPRGYRTEINIHALQWLQKNAATLQKGFVLTLGNGMPADEFYSLSRYRGNIICDNEEPPGDILYRQPGETNIRSRINFTALHHWGRRFGLECCGFTSQAHFLHGLGLLEALDKIHASARDQMLELYRNVMSLSSRFNILVQHKGLNDPRLSGLQFAKNYV